MKKLFLFFALVCLCSSYLLAQSSTIKPDKACINCPTDEPASSAVFEIQSTDKGILLPRMTTTERTNINSPADALLVYDTDTQSFWYYNASQWQELGASLSNQNLAQVLAEGNDANTFKIVNLSDPSNPQDAATKAYVDTNDDVNDADADPSNEIQALASVLTEGNDANNNTITNLSDPSNPQDAATKSYVDSNDEVDDADASPINEIQTLSSVLTEGNDANNTAIVNLADPSNPQDAATKAYVDANDEVEDADADAMNEIQDLELSGNTLSLTDDATTVDLSGFVNNWTTYGEAPIIFGFNNTVAGDSSSAVGYNNKATGFRSSAFGYFNDATGDYSSAFGYDNDAREVSSSAFGYFNFAVGISSSAFGYNNEALIESSSAFGYFNKANQLGTSAFGYSNSATGLQSSAFGLGNNATGTRSSAFGFSNEAAGARSSAFGSSNEATGDESSVFGYDNDATGDESSAFGYETLSNIYGLMTVGRYNATPVGSATTWVATEPVFVIGNGEDDSNRSTALTILKNGKVGIGDETPDELLEVAGNVKATKFIGDGSMLTDIAQDLSLNGDTLNLSDDATAVDLSAFLNNWMITDGRDAAFGYNNVATGDSSIAVGYNNTATNTFSNAFGYTNDATGAKSSAVGYFNDAIGTNSSAFGYANFVTGGQSSAVGYFNDATGTNSSAFGYGTFSDVYGLMAVGIHNANPDGSATTWVDTDPVFVIGNGENGSNRSTALTILKNGKVGIGDTTPDELLEVAGNVKATNFIGDGSMLTNLNSDVNNWTTYGEAPIIFGFNNTVAGDSSSAVGYNNVATGFRSSAFGYINEATGRESSAVGYDNDARGDRSSAFGFLNEATEDQSSAVGYNNVATGFGSSAFGDANEATEFGSSAFGYDNEATGVESSAFGYDNEATGARSSAFGFLNDAIGTNSSAFGYGTLSDVYGLMAVGSCNADPVGSETTWVATDPVFVIGNGEDFFSRSTALTILKNGKVGIGDTTPDELLEVAGNVKATNFIGDGSMLTNLPSSSSLWTENGSDIYRNTGNVGIGTTNPAYPLDLGSSIGKKLALYQVGGGNFYGFGIDSGTLEFFASSPTTSSDPAMVINNLQNVGIGTTTPSAKLEVKGGKFRAAYNSSQFNAAALDDINGDLATAGIVENSAGDLYARAFWGIVLDRHGGNAGNSSYTNGVNPDGGSLAVRYRTDATTFRTDLLVDENGDVGIGTTNPTSKLDVNGDARVGTLNIDGADSGLADETRINFRASDDSNRFQIETDLDGSTANDLLGFRSFQNDNILVLRGDGDVGIGTTAPTSRLDVNGTARIRNLPSGSGTTVVADGSGNLLLSSSSPNVNEQRINDLEQENASLKTTVVKLEAENEAIKARLAKIEALLSGKVENISTTTSTLTSATLSQNAPNPFDEVTRIDYFIPEGVKNASLQVMDQNGRIIKRIPIQATGKGQITLQANLLSAGTYSYSLVLDGQVMETKQMVLTH